MDRKEFLHQCIYKSLIISGFTVSIQSCGSSIYYAQSQLKDGKIEVNKAEFEGVHKDGSQYKRKFVMVKSVQLDYPMCLYKRAEDDFLAIYTKCTHQGCEVKPQGEYFVCPCHGSEYSLEGKVLNPPAEKDLKLLPTSVSGDIVYIQT